MGSKSVRLAVFFLIFGFLALHFSRSPVQAQEKENAPAGIVYSQPHNLNGTILFSSWRDPGESNYDQYIWENFTLQSTQVITEVQWLGGYDPARFGSGGTVLDFTVAFYPSIASGTEPDVAHPPLVQYQTGGDAGETLVGTFDSTAIYHYQFTLPAPVQAAAGTKYWVYIFADQQGYPDWGFAVGTGGEGNHYQKNHSMGDIYRFYPGDTAFTLLGPAQPVNNQYRILLPIVRKL